MSRTRTKLKSIACLEGHWDGDLARPLSVRPILETAASMNYVRFIHLSCNTEPELNYNLSLLRRRQSFQILYLAFHGAPGVLRLPRVDVSLEQLAVKLGRGFAGRVVHLGTCQTIDVSPRRLRAFLDRTGIALLLGYRHEADWIEANRQEIFFLWRPYLRDPKDDLLLEVAVAGNCEAIITYNRRDFAGAEKFGLRILTPGEFLKRIGGLR